MTAEISIVIPTHNTRDTVRPLLCLIDEACAGMRWEAVFVDDDSNDGTADAIRKFARLDERVRCIKRIGRQGRVSAAVEGMLSCSAPYVAVMKPDMNLSSHALPQLLQQLIECENQIIFATQPGKHEAPTISTSNSGGLKKLVNRFGNKNRETEAEMIALKHELIEPLARNLNPKGEWFNRDNFSNLEYQLKMVELKPD